MEDPVDLDKLDLDLLAASVPLDPMLDFDFANSFLDDSLGLPDFPPANAFEQQQGAVAALATQARLYCCICKESLRGSLCCQQP